MKKVKHILGSMLVALTLLTSCSKEDPAAPIIAILDVPTAEDFQNVRNGALQDLVQTAQFNAEDGIVFTSSKGAELTIAAGCLLVNGNPASGAAELTFVEAYDRGDMLTANKATVGMLPGGDKGIIISGGEFYISVKQNGGELELGCQMQLIIDASLTGGLDPEMSLWKGNVDNEGDIVWVEDEDPGQGGVFGDGGQYYSYFDEFGWTNVDRFYNDPRPKTTLQVQNPDGYDSDNSGVYLSYDGEPNALAQLDTYDAVTNMWSEHYGQIPVGLEMHIIFVTEDDGQWSWAIMGVTVAANDIYDFSNVALTTGSKAQLVAEINSLP